MTAARSIALSVSRLSLRLCDGADDENIPKKIREPKPSIAPGRESGSEVGVYCSSLLGGESIGGEVGLFHSVYGVDFSGARLAGLNTWVARLEPVSKRRPPRFRLASLDRLADLCGTAERAPALAHLTRLVAGSERALWAFDFPFALPVEIVEPGASWLAQLDLVRGWGGNAPDLGRECVRRALELGDRMHIRRLTDVEERAPFDTYYYRIIYQTFHGMRDVLDPIRRTRRTAVLPFQYRRLATASRVVVEACPASTLKRLGLPHQNYKQPAGGPLAPKRLRARRAILAGLADRVEISAAHRRVVMRNGGGDALDAVLAAVGAAGAWDASDHAGIARHPRYSREGRMYV